MFYFGAATISRRGYLKEPGVTLLHSSPQRHLPALLLAVILGALATLRDLFLLRSLWLYVGSDSPAYLRMGTDEIRSLPYPLMNTLVNGAANPAASVLLQVIVASFALGALVYVIGKKHLVLASGIGILLLTDFLWAAANLSVLTESAFTSFHLLCLAFLLNR